MPSAELLTVEEVAKRLRCHPQTVRRYIWSGKLGFVKVGGMVRVPESALERTLAELGEPTPVDDRNKGVDALRAVVQSRRVSPEDVVELERLIVEGEQAIDWGSPV